MKYRGKKKKRIRKVSVVEAELTAHEERYKKHLLWKEICTFQKEKSVTLGHNAYCLIHWYI